MAKGDDLPPPAKKARTADGDAATNGAVGAAAAGTSRPAAAGLPPLAGAAQAAAAVAGGGRHKASEKPSVTQFGELQASVDVLRGLGGGDEAGEGDAEEVEEELQAAVAKLLEARAHKAKRKQQQQLETLKASVEAQVGPGASACGSGGCFVVTMCGYLYSYDCALTNCPISLIINMRTHMRTQQARHWLASPPGRHLLAPSCFNPVPQELRHRYLMPSLPVIALHLLLPPSPENNHCSAVG